MSSSREAQSTPEEPSLDERVSAAIAEAKDAAIKANPRRRQANDEESAHQRLARRTGKGFAAFGLVLDKLDNAIDAEEVEKLLLEFPHVRAKVVYDPGRAWITAPDDLAPDTVIEKLREAGYTAYLTRTSLHRRATRLEVSPRRRPQASTAAQQMLDERVRRRETALRNSGNHEVLFTARELVTKKRFITSAILSIPVIFLSLIPEWQFEWWQYVCAALTSVVALWGGWPFHRAMIASLRRKMSALDGASSVAIFLAWLWSIGQLAFGPAGEIGFTNAPTWFPFEYRRTAPAEVFFDVACGMTVLLLAGRLMTRYNRIRSSEILRLLRIPADRQVTVVRKGGTSAEPKKVRLPIAELNIGDDIVVPSGVVIPVDGRVIGGASAIDAQALGIGAKRRPVKVNSRVWAGSINIDKPLKVRVTRTGSKTRAAGIARWLQEAIREEAAVHQTAIRSASVLVPWAIGIALVSFGAWWLISGAAGGAFAVALAVLSGVAPVALAMSTSTVQRIGILVAATNGVLIRGDSSFRALANADVVMFNRVGTLTEGEMHVLRIAAEEGENPELVLRVAGALVMESEHPVSTAVVRACRASRDAGSGGGEVPHWIETNHLEITEDGAFVGQVKIPVKNADGEIVTRFVEASLWRPRDMSVLDERMAVAALGGGAPMVVSWRGKVRGVITVGEDIKEDAVEGIDALESMGVDTMMITRDPYPVARRFADRLGISRVFAGIIGARKANAVRQVHAGGETVVVVGNNDILDCLRAADVGILMDDSEGTANLELEDSGVVSLRSGVMAVPDAIELSRVVVRTMDTNIWFAWTYNCVVLLLSMLGLINPLLSALLMIISSLLIEWRSRRLSSRRAMKFIAYRRRLLRNRLQ